MGRWLGPVLRVVEASFLFLVIQAMRPLPWLAERIRIDPDRFREIAPSHAPTK